MIDATTRAPSSTNYRSEYEQHAASHPESDWLRTMRRTAIDRFEHLGFPTTRLERWKYTNVGAIAKQSFAPAADPLDVDDERIEAFELRAPVAARLVFVDGRYRPSLSTLPSDNADLVVESLAAALEAGSHEIDKSFGRAADDEDHAFVALNTALFQDGARVRVTAGRSVDDPIELIFVSTDHGPPRAFHPRILIELSDGSRATLLEKWVGFDEAANLTNVVVEIHLGRASTLEHYKVIDESVTGLHIASTRARLGRDALLRSHLFALGGAMARNELDVALMGEGASCDLSGLYLTHGQEHVDCQIFIDHAVPNCTSQQRFHGILDGRSRGVFNGRVLVRQDAQGTAAHQTSRNLLLSAQAVADTKPQLEIHADDVRCTHGATIGQLDEGAIFYLRSRGIGEIEARSLLTRAFANQVTDGIRLQALAERIDWSLSRRFLERADPRNAQSS